MLTFKITLPATSPPNY